VNPRGAILAASAKPGAPSARVATTGQREPGEDDGDETPAIDLAAMADPHDDVPPPEDLGEPVETPPTDLGALTDARDGTSKRLPATTVDAPWEPLIPFATHEVPAFPVETLPPTLRAFAEAVAEDTQTPVDLAAMLSLATVAACVQGRAIVRVSPSYSEPLSLFVAVVAESGERKSAVVSHVAGPLHAWEREAAGQLAGEIEGARADRKALEKRKDALEDKAAKAKTSDSVTAREEAKEIAATLAKTPMAPDYPRLLAADVTPEALARLMAAQNEKMAVLSPEGGIFETMAGRYNNGVANLDVFLKGHAGDALRVDRRSAPPITMNRPALTLGLAVQRDVIRGLADKPGFRGRGLIARFLCSLPHSLVGQRRIVTKAVPEPVRRAYDRSVRRLLSGEIDRVRDVLQGREASGPEALTVARAGESVRVAFATKIEPRLGPGGDLHHIADWGSKLTGALVRIAALLHAVTCVEASGPVAGEIQQGTMTAAVRIADYLVFHALAAFAEMNADPNTSAARAVFERALTFGGSTFVERDLHQALRGQARFRKASDVRTALSALVERGYVRKIPPASPTARPGRRPSAEWEVNPMARESTPCPQNAHNAHNAAGPPNCEDCEDIEDDILRAADGGAP
jgi:replicative DNA helicase